MKISVSLDREDVRFLDTYARDHSCGSRSAAVGAAIRALRESSLTDDYVQAFSQWMESGEDQVWEPVVADGLGPAKS